MGEEVSPLLGEAGINDVCSCRLFFFSSTNGGATLGIITTYNFSGPAVWMMPVSDEMCTFLLSKLN